MAFNDCFAENVEHEISYGKLPFETSVIYKPEEIKSSLVDVPKIEKTERGWAGHFIAADKCLFRRNTLLETENGIRVIISTVGNYILSGRQTTLGYNRYYETMVFFAENHDGYWDANVTKEISVDSNSGLPEINFYSDLAANKMHEDIVDEIFYKLSHNIQLKIKGED
jgi:hypothetical protein